MWSQELDLMILVGPFQLRIFSGSVSVPVVPTLASQLSVWDEDSREAQEVSIRAFIAVLAMKHCKGLTGHASIAKMKYFKGLLLIFVWGMEVRRGGHKDLCQISS